ncbi:hypothetical protein FOQG_08855 [Fusarium oxysporum f. sp. raphani 54005]|uniref:Uncharacterized protein n=4 Tax=Fusarium oxysporum TaxID=5507 RepID=X0C041_FUSOX|nr:hypothetical protein FOVG_13805 [Fusarium oxysporum f. sp. pisi HDV247]EXK87506.1 hypothetical protein FOQG_08855 [Fusarium oxysporum f. sp. raphani 54005]EXL69009.1 hypothetical protein FOPG_14964 [Fusarium oxysporum f. sp. conglutinans race 2 54008]EXM19116.1 hypothetical protein FOTG_12901 [Fusarium oxysporum f. sp. vasinfectum 25433]
MSSPITTDVGSPENSTPSDGMLAWLSAILLPIMALTMMFLVGEAKVFVILWSNIAYHSVIKLFTASGPAAPRLPCSSKNQQRHEVEHHEPCSRLVGCTSLQHDMVCLWTRHHSAPLTNRPLWV